MGECFISRRGGGESYTLPVLNENYPQNVTVTASPNGTVSFSVQISEHGKPAEYTYQWYIDGSAISGATSTIYTRGATASDVGTHAVYCNVTNKAGTVTSRAATFIVKSAVPSGSANIFSGNGKLVKENDYNWRLYCYETGTLTLPMDTKVDVFLVGGGGGGSSAYSNANGGGGGGYTKTVAGVTVTGGTPYTITVGAGGAGNTSGRGGTGGTSSAFNYSATGGKGGTHNHNNNTDTSGGAGGSGGGGGSGGRGGTNGGNGTVGGGDNPIWSGGQGQRTTTGEFGNSSATRYSGGGGGSYNGPGGSGGGGKGCNGQFTTGYNGGTNTGGGGGGGGLQYAGGNGGSGIVVIRNAR